MSFPINPTDGQTAVLNGIPYAYSTSTTTWDRLASTVTATTTLLVTGSASATSTTTGALQVAGGAGIGGNLYVGGEIVAQKLTIEYTTVTTTLVQTDDIIRTYNATQSTGTTTGALQVSGGAGIGRDLYVGGAINIGQTSTVAGAVIITTATIAGYVSQSGGNQGDRKSVV